MQELITYAGDILRQSAELMKNPAVATAVSGMVSWLSGVFGKKQSTEEKLRLIEENKHTDETVRSLQSNLEFLLEDNRELQEQLSARLREIDTVMKQEGMSIVTKTNTMNITGDNNTAIQGIEGKGDINISI